MADTVLDTTPPRRLYREPAKADTIKCPSCGGPITLKTFGTSERVACPFCGSLLGADESGALALVQAAARARQPTTLPLHARGALFGTTWEIIGVCKRSCRVDGVTYPWEEFYLYNPYAGFRWLVHALTDHHWTFGGTLDAAPRLRGGSLTHRGTSFRHFQSAVATVDYVEGEFTWQVEVGDKAKVHDYVAPPHAISLEASEGDDGEEVNRTSQVHVDPAEVWRAFRQPGKPPRARGVGMIEPNPWRLGGRTFAAWGLLSALSIGAWFVEAGAARETTALEVDGVAEVVSAPLTIAGDAPQNLAVEIYVPSVANNWRYFEGMLVDAATEEATAFEIEVSYYSGVDGGESWSEGSTHTSVTLGGVAPGNYVLQVTPAAAGAGAELLPFTVEVRQGVFLHRYGVAYLLLALVALATPLALSLSWERRRWQNSDHPPSS